MYIYISVYFGPSGEDPATPSPSCEEATAAPAAAPKEPAKAEEAGKGCKRQTVGLSHTQTPSRFCGLLTACVCVCIYVYMCVYLFVYAYIHIYIYTHVYIFMYTYVFATPQDPTSSRKSSSPYFFQVATY